MKTTLRQSCLYIHAICTPKTAEKLPLLFKLTPLKHTQQVSHLACPTFGRGPLFCLHNNSPRFQHTDNLQTPEEFQVDFTMQVENKGFFCLASLALMQVEIGGTQSVCPSAVSCPDFFFFLLLVLSSLTAVQLLSVKVNHTII